MKPNGRAHWRSELTLVERRLQLLALVGLFALWPLFPADQGPGRSDLVPWTMLCVMVLGSPGARGLGPGPNPALQVLSTRFGVRSRRGAGILATFLLFSLYEAMRLQSTALAEQSTALAVISAGAGLLMIGLAWAGRHEGRSAWVPRGWPVWSVWTLIALPFAAAAVLLGFWTAHLSPLNSPPDILALASETSLWAALSASVAALPAALLSGLAFVALGLAWDRVQNARQYLESQRGARYRVFWLLLPYGRAFLLGTGGTLLMYLAPLSGVQARAMGIAVGVFLTARWIWPARGPVACACLLHEVQPVSQVAAEQEHGGATAVMAPPRGTLRFQPAFVRRTRTMHPWLIRLESPGSSRGRLEVAPLWVPQPADQLEHILGPARFPRLRGKAQWRRVGITLTGRRALQALVEGDVEERRLAIVHPAGAAVRRPDRRAYRWEARRAENFVDWIDASSPCLELFDGSVIIVESGSAALLYELEIGTPLFEGPHLLSTSAGEYQDYVKL